MNKLIFLLLLFSFSLPNQRLIAQDTVKTLEGFLDLKWGDNPATVKRKMLKRDGVVFDKSQSKKEMMIFHGGTFSGHKVSSYLVDFYKDGFISVSVFLEDISYSGFIQTLWSIKRGISDRYGRPIQDFNIFKSDDNKKLDIIDRSITEANWYFFDNENTFSIGLDVYPVTNFVPMTWTSYGIMVSYSNVSIEIERSKEINRDY